MFCIICNASAVSGNYCKKHFLEKHALFSIENARASFCKDCNTYTYKKDRAKNIEELIDVICLDTMKTSYKIEKMPSFRVVGNKILVKLTCVGKINSIEKTEMRDFMIILRKMLCENCSRKTGGYHEAAIQVRGKNSKKIYEFIMKNLDDKEITNMRNSENGFDVRIIKKGQASALAKFLKEEGFDVTVSFKLVKEKKGQKLYRNFYAVR